MLPQGTPSLAPDSGIVVLRVVQYLVDSLIAVAVAVLGVLAVALLPSSGLGEGVVAMLSIIVLLAVLLWFGVYWVLLPVRLQGQTLAMRWFGLRVVSLDTEEPASAGQQALRLVGLLFVDGIGSGLVGLVTMAATQRRQRVGDLLSRTVVVRA